MIFVGNSDEFSTVKNSIFLCPRRANGGQMSIFCQKQAQNSTHKMTVFRQNKNPKTLVNTGVFGYWCR